MALAEIPSLVEALQTVFNMNPAVKPASGFIFFDQPARPVRQALTEEHHA